MTDKICSISLLEADVLLIVKDRSNLTTREVYEDFLKKEVKEKHGDFTSYTTVMSTLNSLAEKNILKVNKSQKTYFYSTEFSRKETFKSIIKAVAEKLL
jgi:predicted transcriptional regulator